MAPSPHLFGLPRRGAGTAQDPWIWSGRFHLRDRHHEYVPRVGNTTDVEDELHHLAHAERPDADLRVRVLVPGRRREPQRLHARLANGQGRGKVMCETIHGAHWSLGQLLGTCTARHGLVTLHAWLTLQDDVEPTDELFDAIRTNFAAWLGGRSLREVFSVRDFAPRLDARGLYRLNQLLADYTARGILEVERGHGRRRFIVRRTLPSGIHIAGQIRAVDSSEALA